MKSSIIITELIKIGNGYVHDCRALDSHLAISIHEYYRAAKHKKLALLCGIY